MMTSLEQNLKAEAERLGFSLCGIAPATEADSFSLYEAWLDAGYSGDMHYLHRNRAPRRHPDSILPGVRSVVMLGIEYASTPHPDSLPPHQGKVARYAQGRDYHREIWARLDSLGRWLLAAAPDARTRGVVDTAPLLERDFARRAGLGWIGKNTMLINPTRGSYFFLAALLTNLELHPDPPFASNHCGTCTACLDACPTQAFPQPGTLDATKCISYLTIEHRGPLPDGTRLHGWVFGCDVCQEVCPWNRFAGPGALPHHPELRTLDCEELLQIDDSEFRRRFRLTALARSKREGLQRNAAALLDEAQTE